ncbi:MAG TPA: diacylglycerol kinase [Armatimonadetes bacterium]|nr:diacylglycerol kinase [Armatimonadota bacterium]MCA1997166.1 diacylglycerol kinase [Armatimonadota bacterium]HCE01424.1 diacylglycerol kinase [Armatimonadota bacterium]
MSRRDLITPFKAAIRGLVYTFRTQRHMRFHIYVVLTVVLLGIFFGLRLRELMILIFTVSLVLVAEMFNSAIEATVDLVEPRYHPLAKFAKDIAAGAVLITTIVALVVGALLVLEENRWEEIKLSLVSESIGVTAPVRIVFGCFLVFLVVVIGKAMGKHGQVLQGGLVSGHAAYGFFLAGSIMFLTDRPLVSAIAILLACLVAQSRWEARIHSIFELTLGAAVGVILSLVLFGNYIPK